MFVLNRKNIVRPLIEDLFKIGMVNADDINSEITPKFKTKRKKMTPVQRQMCDESEFFQVMQDVMRGMYLVCVVCFAKGAIKPFQWEGSEQQVYLTRYGLFSKVPVPRYVDFEAYKNNFLNDLERPVDKLIDEAKASFTLATQRLKNLIAVEEAQRNVVHYPNDMLTGLQKLIVRNSLLTAKVKLMGEKPFTVVIDWANCMQHLPALDFK